MGNYGNTVDRWYHRAAVVMWPRDRNFVIRAKVSPSWAVDQLAARIKAGALPDARDGARSLLPFWARHAPQEEGSAFFPKLVQLALSLQDAELAHGLLAPFGPHRLSARSLPTFAAMVERHGEAWSQGVFAAWSRGSDWVRRDGPPWLLILPRLFEALLSRAPRHGAAVAAWLLTREVKAWERGRIASRDRTAYWLDDAVGDESTTLLALVEGAAVIASVSTRDHLVTLLTSGKTALPMLAAGALLEACREGRTPAAVRALGLHELHRHVADALERTLALPARAADDWSIDAPMKCKCDLCAHLSSFLRDGRRVEHAWPLVEAQRQHVHSVIGLHRLPVTHVTTRSGRPYTIVLTKQKALFEQVAALRARQKALVGRLKSQRHCFASGEDR